MTYSPDLIEKAHEDENLSVVNKRARLAPHGFNWRTNCIEEFAGIDINDPIPDGITVVHPQPEFNDGRPSSRRTALRLISLSRQPQVQKWWEEELKKQGKEVFFSPYALDEEGNIIPPKYIDGDYNVYVAFAVYERPKTK